MKKISIFVAGSTELDEEMTQVKATVSDLVLRYGLSGYKLEASNFENHGDFQTTYNDFIQNEADIVLFILEGRIGEHTETEFKIAMDEYTKKRKPEVFVFVKPGDEDSVEYQHVLDVLSGKMEKQSQYFVKYSDIEDLENKVRNRLDRYLLKREKGVRRTRRWGWITAAIVALSSMVFPIREYSEIVFAGGGSVANFLKNEIGIDVNKDLGVFRKTIYTRLPSGSAWTMLSEDVNLEMLDQRKDGNKVRRSFRPVCLSAGKIDTGVFQSVADSESSRQAAIVECYLGEDPLTVYISDSLYGNMYEELAGEINDGCISREGLSKLLRKTNAAVFATNKDSGTRKMYASVLQEEDTLVFSDKIHLFNEASPKELIDESFNNFIILGSKNYKLNVLEKVADLNLKKLIVKDDLGNIQSKGMYIYFMVYGDSKEDCYTINWRLKPIIRKLQEKGKVNMSDDIWAEKEHYKLKLHGKKGVPIISISSGNQN